MMTNFDQILDMVLIVQMKKIERAAHSDSTLNNLFLNLCHGSLIFFFTFTFLLPLHHHNRKSKSLDISGAKPPTRASTFDDLEQK